MQATVTAVPAVKVPKYKPYLTNPRFFSWINGELVPSEEGPLSVTVHLKCIGEVLFRWPGEVIT